MEGKDGQVCLRRHKHRAELCREGPAGAGGHEGCEVDPGKPAAFGRILAE